MIVIMLAIQFIIACNVKTSNRQETDGWKARSQNFKYLSFQKILDLL